jgi:hypothetical protein
LDHEEQILAMISRFSKYLLKLRLINFRLHTLELLPLGLKRLKITSASFKNLYDWTAPQLSQLLEISFEGCPNLKSLAAFPSRCPEMVYFSVERCPLQTLEDLPVMPKLEKFRLIGTKLKNYQGIPICRTSHRSGYDIAIIPLISLHGFQFEQDIAAILIESGEGFLWDPTNQLRRQKGYGEFFSLPIYYFLGSENSGDRKEHYYIHETLKSQHINIIQSNESFFKPDKKGKFPVGYHVLPSPYIVLRHSLPPFQKKIPNYLPPSYLPYLDSTRYSPKEIYSHFALGPTSLAERYARDEKLSDFEKDRIVHEGTLTTFKVLHHRVGTRDPLLHQLATRWDVDLTQQDLLL